MCSHPIWPWSNQPSNVPVKISTIPITFPGIFLDLDHFGVRTLDHMNIISKCHTTLQACHQWPKLSLCHVFPWLKCPEVHFEAQWHFNWNLLICCCQCIPINCVINCSCYLMALLPITYHLPLLDHYYVPAKVCTVVWPLNTYKGDISIDSWVSCIHMALSNHWWSWGNLS